MPKIDRDIKEDISDLDSLFSDTKPKMSGDLPPGVYQCKINSVVFTKKAKKSGLPMLQYQFTVQNGEEAGRKFSKVAMLSPQQQREYAFGDLIKLGHEKPESIGALKEILSELEGSYCELRIVESKGYINKYFTKAIDTPDTIDEDEEEDEEKPAKKKKPAKDEDEDEDDDTTDDSDDDEEEEEDEKPAKKKKPAKDEDDEDAEEDAEDDEEKPKKKKLILDFEDDDISEGMHPKIEKLANKNNVDPEEYESKLEVMKAIAQKKKITGIFDTAKELFDELL